jgi:hypothetical protein
MPNIDHLLSLSVQELTELTDEQLLANYAEVFNLEPRVPVNAIVDDDEDEDDGQPRQPKTKAKRKQADKKTKMEQLKEQILAASKCSVDEDFKL